MRGEITALRERLQTVTLSFSEFKSNCKCPEHAKQIEFLKGDLLVTRDAHDNLLKENNRLAFDLKAYTLMLDQVKTEHERITAEVEFLRDENVAISKKYDSTQALLTASQEQVRNSNFVFYAFFYFRSKTWTKSFPM